MSKPREVGNSLMEAEEGMDIKRNDNSPGALDAEFLREPGSLLAGEISLDQILKGLESYNKELRFILQLIKSHEKAFGLHNCSLKFL